MFVILDNGHGVETPGKRSPDGRLREYKYAREIVDLIYKKLSQMNIPCTRLVPEDNDVDLYTRYRRANVLYEKHKDAILISIHCNAAGPGDKWMNGQGWEAWTSVGKTKSDELCELLYKGAEKYLPKGTKIRTDKVGLRGRENNFAILCKTKCPAVLTENLFQDNKEDVEYLLSEEGKQAIANLHIEGIVNYYSQNN